MATPLPKKRPPLRARIVRRLPGVVRFLAVAYPVALVASVALLRWVGEKWWLTAGALYLPRVLFAVPLPFLALALWRHRMRRLLLAQAASVVVVLFPLMGFVLPWPTPSDPGAPTMRVLSFNVNSGAGGVEAVVDEIDGHAPDVVLLQETADTESFARLLRSRYATVQAWDQFVVATKYPIASTSTPDKLSFDGKLHRARFLKVAMETPLGRVVFYDVHPTSPREALGMMHGVRTMLRGASAPVMEANVGLRTLQVKTFAEAAAAETDPVVIAGDTNLPGLSAVFGQYLSGYADGFARAGWGFGYTFPTNKWRPWMRIDRILASDALRFTRFEVGQSKVSDHRCVVADLQRAAGATR
jgi:endonuclease/exonuclease/phosphatase (EEP) superfamily protein YafD